MARPIDPAYPVNQSFGGYATRGVVGRLNGTELEYLVALYGDYQAYGHAGADIACPIGTPVYAMLDGEVVYAGWGEDLPGNESWGPAGYFQRWGLYKNFPGIVTVIKHPQFSPPRYSIYGHQSSNDEAPVGTQVSAGQVIGKSGNTKTRTEYVGPHLHVAMLTDPVNYSTGNGLIFGCADPVPYFSIGSQIEGFLMALNDKQQAIVLAAAERIVNALDRPHAKALTTDDDHLNAVASRVTDWVLNTPIPRYGKGAELGPNTSVGAMVSWHDSSTLDVIATVAATAANDGATVEEIKAAVAESMRDNVVKVDVNVQSAE